MIRTYHNPDFNFTAITVIQDAEVSHLKVLNLLLAVVRYPTISCNKNMTFTEVSNASTWYEDQVLYQSHKRKLVNYTLQVRPGDLHINTHPQLTYIVKNHTYFRSRVIIEDFNDYVVYGIGLVDKNTNAPTSLFGLEILSDYGRFIIRPTRIFYSSERDGFTWEFVTMHIQELAQWLENTIALLVMCGLDFGTLNKYLAASVVHSIGYHISVII